MIRRFARCLAIALAGAVTGCGHVIAPPEFKPISECQLTESGKVYASIPWNALIVANSASPACRSTTAAAGEPALFQLPVPLSKPAILETVTEHEGLWLPAATIYVPRFTFMDDALRPLSTCEPPLYQTTGKLYASGPVAKAFYGACVMPVATRYLRVDTDPSLLTSRPIRYLSPGGAGASAVLQNAERVYQTIDKREFASGRVGRVPASNAFLAVDIPRKAQGEIRFQVSID